MSEYIFGSSLRAAKSKVNYLFEGDFRRRPNQNLSGASRSLARGELLQQAAQQRQNREDIRRKEQVSIRIQSLWRGYRCRKLLRTQMRDKFDKIIGNLCSNDKLKEQEFSTITQEFILYYHSKKDESRFNLIIELMTKNQDAVIEFKRMKSETWLGRIRKLLIINLGFLDRLCVSTDSIYLTFLEQFTRPNNILNENEADIIWEALVEHKIYTIFRRLIERSANIASDKSQSIDHEFSRILIELIRRSLSIKPARYEANKVKTSPVCSFFSEFLKGPLDTNLDDFYFPQIMKLEPSGLKPQTVLATFTHQKLSSSGLNSNQDVSTTNFVTSRNQVQESSDGIWLCYSFVRTIHTQIGQLSDSEKINYINILATLVAPAEYITLLSLIAIANDEDTDQGYDELNETTGNNQINQYYAEINCVITRFISIINDLPHINGIKTIIFNNELQPHIHSAIIRICNLMLAHEPLAIFNCRLLYTVAFSKEFSRSLWRGIITSSSTSLFGTTTPIYVQLSRGYTIGNQSWESILPQLRLFCSLYSYLLPTLDDEEFYNEDNKSSMLVDDNEQRESERQQQQQFFTDKELINISAILRNICVELIDILHQGFQDFHGSRFMSFEMKLCFKALVRLVRQLHSRDSRKQFCPNGHWICHSLVIPANKVIDFQLAIEQNGRLLSQMTKDDKSNDRMSTTANEIKTVLILQEIPFVISFQDRVQILHQLLRKEKQIHQSHGYSFGLPGTAIQVKIRRNYIYEDAFEKLSMENEPNLKIPLKVSLINAVGAYEAGIDGGGLTKEFLSELLKVGFDPMSGFFKSTTDQLLYPNPSAKVLFSSLPEGFNVHYEFLGRMLGKAIFEKIMVELPLATFFLAKLLARKHSSDVDLHNLASLDPILYKNLVYLKNYKGDVADLNLDFTISNNELDEHEVVELKPDGSKIPVTRENKIEYVHLVADYRLNKQIRAQCAAFKRGLAQLVDLDWLRMFDPREMQILVSGAPTVIDIVDWRQYTRYTTGYTDESEAIEIFWKVTSQFSEEQKRKLLKFVTSCSLPPLLGFKDLVPQFTIAPTDKMRLPTASTCMNLLKLPECEDEATMRSKLLYAIESNSGFELS